VSRGVTGLRIAVIGCRGIPAGYGGFETFAHELTPRLVELGHDVTVYCRAGYTGKDRPTEYKGVRLLYTPYLRRRELEQLSHEFTAIVDSLRRRFDMYYFLGTRGAPLYVPLRASKRVVVVNTNGLEWKRRKWSRVGRAYLRFAEWVAVRLAADHLVSDARAMADYFRQTYGRESTYLTNGAYPLSELPESMLDRWGLRPGSYYLISCRIEPENNIDLIIKEFIDSGSQRELVVVGGMNYVTPYWNHLQELGRQGRVRFLGPVYGDMLVESLHLGAYAYLHGHEVGGTNPSLLKAMGCGNLAIALDTAFNAENLADAGLRWTKERGSLAEQIRWADRHPDAVAELGARARARIHDHYSWDGVAQAHDAFFRRVARERGLSV
jgi:glycosyltransferase involved in cell wall biosynthesis